MSHFPFVVLLLFFFGSLLAATRAQSVREQAGLSPAEVSTEQCREALLRNPDHQLCWVGHGKEAMTGTSEDHDEWCTAKIRQFNSEIDEDGKYKQTDCVTLKSKCDYNDDYYNHMNDIYRDEAGAKKKDPSWSDQAHSLLLWGTRKVVQAVTFGNVKRPPVPSFDPWMDARVATLKFCKSARRKECTDGNNDALQETMKEFETAYTKIGLASQALKKWLAEYDSTTSHTITGLKVTKFAGYCAALVAAGPIVAKASVMGSSSFLGAAGSKVVAGAAVSSLTAGSLELATQYGEVKAGEKVHIEWSDVVKVAAKEGAIHLAAGGVFLTKGGKYFVDRLANKLVERLANGALLRHASKIQKPLANIPFIKWIAPKITEHATKMSLKTKKEITDLVFDQLLRRTKNVMKLISATYKVLRDEFDGDAPPPGTFEVRLAEAVEYAIFQGEDDFTEFGDSLGPIILNQRGDNAGSNDADENLQNAIQKEQELEKQEDDEDATPPIKSPWSSEQVKKCTQKKGTCIDKTEQKCDGKLLSNKCPGNWKWKCCVVNA